MIGLTSGPSNVSKTEHSSVTLSIRSQFPSYLEPTKFVSFSPGKVQFLVKFLHIGRPERYRYCTVTGVNSEADP